MSSRTTPLVTVIVPFHNAGATVEQTIDSILAQSYGNFEVAVVDEDSDEWNKARLETVAKKSPKIAVLRKRRESPGAARNFGVARSKGDFVAFLDADDVWKPAYLENMVKVAVGNGHDALCGFTQIADENLVPFGPVIGSVIPIMAFSDFVQNSMHTSSVFLSRTAFDEAGGFDERPEFATGEDWDLFQRVARTGRAFKRVEKAEALYRLSPKSTTGRDYGRHMRNLSDGVIQSLWGEDTRSAYFDPVYRLGLGRALREIEEVGNIFQAGLWSLLAGQSADFVPRVHKWSGLAWYKKSPLFADQVETVLLRHHCREDFLTPDRLRPVTPLVETLIDRMIDPGLLDKFDVGPPGARISNMIKALEANSKSGTVTVSKPAAKPVFKPERPLLRFDGEKSTRVELPQATRREWTFVIRFAADFPKDQQFSFEAASPPMPCLMEPLAIYAIAADTVRIGVEDRAGELHPSRSADVRVKSGWNTLHVTRTDSGTVTCTLNGMEVLKVVDPEVRDPSSFVIGRGYAQRCWKGWIDHMVLADGVIDPARPSADIPKASVVAEFDGVQARLGPLVAKASAAG